MRKLIWILPSLMVPAWSPVLLHLQIQVIKAPTFYPAGWLWGLNEMLHIQCLACFKCLINVKARNYCAFESLFLPSPPAPAHFLIWVGFFLLWWEGFVYLIQSWFCHLSAQCIRSGKNSNITEPHSAAAPLASPFLPLPCPAGTLCGSSGTQLC